MNITNEAATCSARPHFLNRSGKPFAVSRTSRAFEVKNFRLSTTSLTGNIVIINLGGPTCVLSTDGI